MDWPASIGCRTARRALVVSAVGAVVCGFVGVGSAGAAPVTVGSPLTLTFSSATLDQAATVVNTALGESGALLTSPWDGTVVRWHITQASGGPFYLSVLTLPDGLGPVGSTFTGAETSTGEVPTSLATQTFTTDLPIKVGQIIGLDNSKSGDQMGVSLSAPNSEVCALAPPVADGSTATANNSDCDSGAEFGFNAVVQPLPSVYAVRPDRGWAGRKITIKGRDLDGTTAVRFGSTAAKSFEVTSDSTIHAVAPAHHLGVVHVMVLNPGKSPTNSNSLVLRRTRFKFKQVCIVPKLKGKTLSSARKALKAAHCKLGKVTGPTGATKVSKQKPKHGKVLAAGSKVSVTVKL
jgi:hypothetical protein